MARGGHVNVIFSFSAAPAPAPPPRRGRGCRQVVVGRSDGGGNFFKPFNVTYDHHAVLIGGKRRMLVSAGLHYPVPHPRCGNRGVSGYCNTLRASCLGLSMWPSLIANCKEGGADVIETYVFWNRHEPAKGKAEMQTLVTKVVTLMKEEKLYSWQGGPIILQQIDTCNAFYCDGFKPNSYNSPTIWTEDWDGWYADWGGALPHRPAKDSAFVVARFYRRSGSLQNYYMMIPNPDYRGRWKHKKPFFANFGAIVTFAILGTFIASVVIGVLV
uniref:beta-galactosidase n=1 Tax=Oryza brachyantha TaxID=4533 RepID=J3NCX0_ORYBR